MQRDEFLNQSRPFGWKLAFKQRAIRNKEGRLIFAIDSMDVGRIVLFLGKMHEDNNSIEGSDSGHNVLPFAARIIWDISLILNK